MFQSNYLSIIIIVFRNTKSIWVELFKKNIPGLINLLNVKILSRKSTKIATKIHVGDNIMIKMLNIFISQKMLSIFISKKMFKYLWLEDLTLPMITINTSCHGRRVLFLSPSTPDKIHATAILFHKWMEYYVQTV